MIFLPETKNRSGSIKQPSHARADGCLRNTDVFLREDRSDKRVLRLLPDKLPAAVRRKIRAYTQRISPKHSAVGKTSQSSEIPFTKIQEFTAPKLSVRAAARSVKNNPDAASKSPFRHDRGRMGLMMLHLNQRKLPGPCVFRGKPCGMIDRMQITDNTGRLRLEDSLHLRFLLQIIAVDRVIPQISEVLRQNHAPALGNRKGSLEVTPCRKNDRLISGIFRRFRALTFILRKKNRHRNIAAASPDQLDPSIRDGSNRIVQRSSDTPVMQVNTIRIQSVRESHPGKILLPERNRLRACVRTGNNKRTCFLCKKLLHAKGWKECSKIPALSADAGCRQRERVLIRFFLPPAKKHDRPRRAFQKLPLLPGNPGIPFHLFH